MERDRNTLQVGDGPDSGAHPASRSESNSFETTDGVWGPDVGARFAAPVLDVMRSEVGNADTDALLERLGVTQSELDDETAWITLPFLEQLVEALVAATDDPESIDRVSRLSMTRRYIGSLFPLLRLLGSPRALYSDLPKLTANWNRVSLVDVLERGRNSIVLRYGSSPERPERSPLICRSRRAQLAAAPGIWDLPDARVDEQECQHEGGEACVYRVTWRNRVRPGYTVAGALLGVLAGWLSGASLVGSPAIVVLGLIGLLLGFALDRQRTLAEAERFARDQNQALQRMVDASDRRFEQLLDQSNRRERAEASAAQSNRLATMGMLAAGVAHEINNPLTYVLCSLESAADDLPKLSSALQKCLNIIGERIGSEEFIRLMGKEHELLDPAMLDDIRACFDDALGGSRRIRDVARGLRAFARVDRGRLLPVELIDVIEVAITMVSNEIKYRAQLVKEYGEVSTVMANDGRLSQVFLNLLVNAAQAIQEGDREGNEIRVRTWQEGDEVCAEVRDTGNGICAEHLPRLFEPFFTTKEVGKGTGLGLSTVFGIVKQSDGYIWVDSEPGQGATFQVYLPRLDQDEQPWRPRPVAAAAGGGGETILVVEDDDAVRALAVRALGKNGYTLLQANGLRQTLAVLAQCDRIDLLLSDVVMPGGSGPEVAAAVSAAHPDARVMYMSGHMDDAIARHKVLEPGVAFLQKPFTSLDLCGRVREVLDGA